jgi:hypothetical protein
MIVIDYDDYVNEIDDEMHDVNEVAHMNHFQNGLDQLLEVVVVHN